jgi:hypothetical protein
MGTDDKNENENKNENRNEDNSALSIAILAARQALDASNRAESTARAVAEAMNTVAEALTALTKVIYDAVYEEDDEEDAVAGVVVGENSSGVGENPAHPVDKPVFSEMPELSGAVYPEYTQEMNAMRAAGDPDPLVPLMHITPLSDTYPHELSMNVCWCNPSVVSEGGMHIVAHNAADGREKAEGYKEKAEGYREKMN